MNIRSKIFGNGAAEESPVLKAKKPKGAKADTLNSIPVIREETRRGDTRDQDRHRLPDEQVTLTHEGRPHSVQLVNLSGGGAMVAADFEPTLWDRVELHLGENGTVECAVRWLKGGRIGLEFAHETRLDCSADKQAAVFREVITRTFPDLEFEGTGEADPAGPADLEKGEQRTDGRHPLIWSGMIHHDFQSSPVRLRNISETGAMVECNAPLHVGAEPLLELGEGVSIFASVAWIVGDSAGLKFHQPFDLTLLARARPDVAPARWEAPSYLKAGTTSDSPWADEWGRKSVAELKEELEGFWKR
jgi:hypothetical protein